MAQAKYMTNQSSLKKYERPFMALVVTGLTLAAGYLVYDTGLKEGLVRGRNNRELHPYVEYTIDNNKYFIAKEDDNLVLKKLEK